MSTEELHLHDLYETAWLLSCGFHLEEMLVETNARATVTFVIAGDGVADSIEAFRSGQATGNVALFTFALEKLKDRMFAKLREPNGVKRPDECRQSSGDGREPRTIRRRPGAMAGERRNPENESRRDQEIRRLN